MSDAHRVGSLEIHEDLPFQEREWKIQRAAWVFMALVIVLALLGLFSTGPLSSAKEEAADGALTVGYERFIRHDGRTTITIEGTAAWRARARSSSGSRRTGSMPSACRASPRNPTRSATPAIGASWSSLSMTRPRPSLSRSPGVLRRCWAYRAKPGWSRGRRSRSTSSATHSLHPPH